MPDPMNSKITTEHETIKEWAEERGGKPAIDKEKPEDTAPIAITFDLRRKGYEPISWDEFFKDFDEEELALLYQEKTYEGQPSRYYRLIYR